MSIAQLDVQEAMLRNYIPYAKMTIQERAIPDGRDGMKPVQRKILYSMHDNNQYLEDKSGKTGKNYKSAKVVGDVMGNYHPHGDSSIYGAMIGMTDDYDGMLVPYLHGEGTFGRVWSDSIMPSKMRYTEVSLNPIVREMFDGLKEDTVEFVPNFDDSTKEPALLPVKFPAVLVNSTVGIAVGISSRIPHFSLQGVCDATIGILNGTAKEPADLLDLIGPPDFTTAGFIHWSKDKLLKLMETGKAKFDISGSVHIKKDSISIEEIPYNTTIDKIETEIRKAVTDGRIKEIKDVINSSGFDKKNQVATMGMEIQLKSNSDPRRVLAKLCAYTSLRNQISFNIRVLMKDDAPPQEIGVFQLLTEWVDWRQGVIQRQYQFKYDKECEEIHLLEAWEKIDGHVKEVVDIITSNNEFTATLLLKQKFGLDDDQVKYFLDKQIRLITADRLKKSLEDLAVHRKTAAAYKQLADNKYNRYNLMIAQLTDIKNKYGTKRKSELAPEVVQEEEDDKIAEDIPNIRVGVVVTKNGFIKKFTNPLEANNCSKLMDADDVAKFKIFCNNTDTLLVFTSKGYCYKTNVHELDNSSRSKFKQLLWKTIDQRDDGKVVFVTATHDYSGYFNVLYENGKGTHVPLNTVAGNRSRYTSVFEPSDGDAFATTCDKFFIITDKGAAAYMDATGEKVFNRKSKFKVARVLKNDKVVGVQPLEKAPNYENETFEEYKRGYTIKIRTPICADGDIIGSNDVTTIRVM